MIRLLEVEAFDLLVLVEELIVLRHGVVFIFGWWWGAPSFRDSAQFLPQLGVPIVACWRLLLLLLLAWNRW